MDTQSEKPSKNKSFDALRKYQREWQRRKQKNLAELGLTLDGYKALPPHVQKIIRSGGTPRGFSRTPPSVDEPRVENVFVYVLVHPAWPDVCKVGHTKDLKTRMNAYQTGCPDNMFRFHCTFAHSNWDFVYEFYDAHRALRLHGEWFDLPAVKAQKAIREVWSNL